MIWLLRLVVSTVAGVLVALIVRWAYLVRVLTEKRRLMDKILARAQECPRCGAQLGPANWIAIPPGGMLDLDVIVRPRGAPRAPDEPKN